MHVKMHTCRSNHGVERQWNTHRPQAGTHGGETKMGRDHFLLVKTDIPQLVNAVLNHSESGAVSSAMSEDRVGSGLVVAVETIKPIGRTLLIKRDAVKNPVCNTPKASSVSAGRVERVRYEVKKQIRTWRSWFKGASEDLNYKVLSDAVGANPRDFRTRSQDTVNNEVAQTGRASSTISPGQTSISLSSGTMQSSSSGTAMAADRPAPEDSNVAVVTVAESSTTQPTTRSTIRETETGDQSRDKRQSVLASRPNQTGADVNACTCRTIVLVAGPEDRDDSAGCGSEQETPWSQEWTSWTSV